MTADFEWNKDIDFYLDNLPRPNTLGDFVPENSVPLSKLTPPTYRRGTRNKSKPPTVSLSTAKPYTEVELTVSSKSTTNPNGRAKRIGESANGSDRSRDSNKSSHRKTSQSHGADNDKRKTTTVTPQPQKRRTSKKTPSVKHGSEEVEPSSKRQIGQNNSRQSRKSSKSVIPPPIPPTKVQVLQGRCASWVLTKAYGFIATEDGTQYFTHKSQLSQDLTHLNQGALVTFIPMWQDNKKDTSTKALITATCVRLRRDVICESCGGEAHTAEYCKSMREDNRKQAANRPRQKNGKRNSRRANRAHSSHPTNQTRHRPSLSPRSRRNQRSHSTKHPHFQQGYQAQRQWVEVQQNELPAYEDYHQQWDQWYRENGIEENQVPEMKYVKFG